MVRVRDLLHWVTYASVLIGYGAVIRYVHVYASVAFIGLSFLALYLHRARTFAVDRWLLNILSVLVVVASAARVSPEYLVEPILEGILLLVAIKLLEAERVRDYMQIYGLCVFELLGSALISLSMIFLLFFVPLAFLLTVSLILLAFDAVDEDMRLPREAVSKVFVQALFICLLSVPVLAVIFIILPRTNYPILMFLNQASPVRSGFSERVQLGDVSAIQEDSTVVFRAAMPEINPSDLYWRGIVLDHFNGLEWTNSGHQRPIGPVRVRGRPVHQTIYLEPYGNKFLFGLDKPINIRLRSAERDADLTYEERHRISRRIRYEVDSLVSPRMEDADSDVARYLQLPQGLPLEIKQLADRLGAGLAPKERAEAFLRFLRNGDFHYALEDLPKSQHPLRDFLFQRHQGNCEYFAASLAVLLRLSGIPARLVGGYKGGYYNSAGGYYLVLQKHAHVWTEAYLRQYGWVRLDPTPYANLQPADLYLQHFLVKLRLLTDILNYYWFKFIINYDFQKQLHFINQVRALASTRHWRPRLASSPVADGLAALTGLAALALLTCGLIRWRRRDPLAKLVARFRSRMRAHGYEMKPSEGLEEFASRIDSMELQRRALDFALDIQPFVYGGRTCDKEHYRKLSDQLRGL